MKSCYFNTNFRSYFRKADQGVHNFSLNFRQYIYKYYFVTFFLIIGLTQWLLEMKRKGGHLNRLLRL